MHFGFYRWDGDYLTWTDWGQTSARQYRTLVRTLCFMCRKKALKAELLKGGCRGRLCGQSICGPDTYYCKYDEESCGSELCNNHD
jgi:hypothetical protein